MKGYKTWAAAALMFGYGLLGAAFGLHTVDEAMKLCLAAMSLVGIGHKLDKCADAMKSSHDKTTDNKQ